MSFIKEQQKKFSKSRHNVRALLHCARRLWSSFPANTQTEKTNNPTASSTMKRTRDSTGQNEQNAFSSKNDEKRRKLDSESELEQDVEMETGDDDNDDLISNARANATVAAVPTALRIGHSAPSFIAKQYVLEGGKLATDPLSLDQMRNGGYMLLVFYPLDFTFVCPTELLEFDRCVGDFQRLGCSVAVISQDSQYCHLHWSKMERPRGGLARSSDDDGTGFRLTMISDMDKEIMRAYGVLDEESGVSLRGTFLIDSKGVLRHYHVNDLSVGRSVDECLRLVEAFQHVDKHGQLCPQGWKRGERAIDAQQADTYFSSMYE